MVQIYRKIDPNGEMGESERNLYALNIVHQFKMNQGDPEGAARTAGQMLQHYKQAATRYAAITAAASETGDVDATMKAALKAYAQVPDGNDMKMSKTKDGHVNWEVTGPDGKKITGGLATPEEIGATAMGLATPGGFENYLVQMASGAKIGGGTAGGARGRQAAAPVSPDDSANAPSKAGEYGTTQEQIGKHVDDYVTKLKASPEYKKSGKELTDNEVSSLKNVMYHIRRSNDVTDDESLQASKTFITAPEPKEGERAPFRVSFDQNAGTAKIRYANGRLLEMPMTDYLPMAAARGDALADAERKANEPKTEGYGEKLGRASESALKAAGGLKEEVVGPITKAASETGFSPQTYGAIAGAPGRALDYVTSAPRNIIRGAVDAAGNALPRNPNDVPPIEPPI
jgi:hypothetical protein